MMAVLIATIAAGISGCANIIKHFNNFSTPNERYGDNYRGKNPTAVTDIQYGSAHEPFKKLEVRSREDIQRTGITAKDVLAVYDQLATEM
jgi:hypothetical protein